MRSDERRPARAKGRDDGVGKAARATARDGHERSTDGLVDDGRKRQIDEQPKDRFGEMLRENMRGEDDTMRSAYIKMFVSEVHVSPDEIIISGLVSVLENGVGLPIKRWALRLSENFNPAKPKRLLTNIGGGAVGAARFGMDGLPYRDCRTRVGIVHLRLRGRWRDNWRRSYRPGHGDWCDIAATCPRDGHDAASQCRSTEQHEASDEYGGTAPERQTTVQHEETQGRDRQCGD